MVLAMAALLGACATTSHTPAASPLSPEEIADHVRQRETWASNYVTWSFSGRAAISKEGVGGGSGRIEWQQHDHARYTIALSAPVTRQSWRLIGDLHSESGRIEGLQGGPREGEFAEDLLLETTGWHVPLQQLGSWVRGMPAAAYPVESIEYDAQGRLSRLRQAGWTVDYTAWRSGAPGQPDLPQQIEAASEGARVRLVIEDWMFATP
ncbi:MAG: outer membrane lipoprotein LolB [Lysobacteraceae bacterium]|nr:MAG: outer membrane lipoprotein LolB [Xanthomonadaceae bacterium]